MLKRGQVTVFVIIALIVVAGIVSFVLLKNKVIKQQIPLELRPVEEYFLSCLKQSTSNGVGLLEEQGGYINLPDFEPGSSYAPSSNTLDYFGTGIPFWYYISGNNLQKEKIPTKNNMQQELSKYINENTACDFSSFRTQGYEITLGEIKSNTQIANTEVKSQITADLKIKFDNKTAEVTSHDIAIDTKLGKFYDTAVRLYNKEKSESFLENYTLDILYLYAPVTGVDLGCSPKIWLESNISDDLKTAIENNFIFIRPKGNYYTQNGNNKYFTLNFASDDPIRFLYSNRWPTKIQVDPSKNGILTAEPVGNQPGLGMLGFCYISYHFVYDMYIPTLIQIYDDKEIFQFPVTVVIKNNVPGQPANSDSYISEPEICNTKDKEIAIYTYDSNLNPVEADISFKCLNQICNIGKTKKQGKDAILVTNVPKCVNGFLIASSEGYQDTNYMISTNEEDSAYIALNKQYPINIEITSNGYLINDNAIVHFISEQDSSSAYFPDQKNVKLAEGDYNITVYVFRNTSIVIPETKQEKCVDVPEGIGGVFGITTEKCFEVTLPGQTLQNTVVGGGKIEQYLTESELRQGKLSIEIGSLNVPKTLDELQVNYANVDQNKIYLEAR